MKKTLLSILFMLIMMFSTTAVVSADMRSNIENPKGILAETYYSCTYVEEELVKVPQFKIEYEYQNGTISSEKYSNYDATKEEWTPERLYEYEYNENGDLIHFIEKIYNATNQTFEITDEEECEYNNAYKRTKQTLYDFENGTRYISCLKEFTYNENNLLTLKTVKNSESLTDELVMTAKYEYEYTNNLVSKETYYYKASSTLILREINEYSYNENGYVSQEFTTEYDYDGETVDGYYQKDFTYDAQNRIILTKNSEQRYNLSTKNLTEVSKTEYFYSDDTSTKIYSRMNSVEYEIQYKEVETKRVGFYQNDNYDWENDEYVLNGSSKEVAVYENGRMIGVEGYELNGAEYAMVTYHEFTYPATQNPSKGNAGIVILIIILILILLFILVYIVWKLEIKGKIKFKENDRLLKFADVVYKPIDNFLFTKVFKKE